MSRRARLIGIVVAAIAVTAATIAAFVAADERNIKSIGAGASLDTVLQTLGRPNVDFSPVPADFLFRAERCQGQQPSRVLVYYRSNLRRSVLVYLDRGNKVNCVERRSYMIVAH
jgi:hypothetical protein